MEKVYGIVFIVDDKSITPARYSGEQFCRTVSFDGSPLVGDYKPGLYLQKDAEYLIDLSNKWRKKQEFEPAKYIFVPIQNECKIEAVVIEKDVIETNNFSIAVRPLISYLCRNHNPHTSVIVTPTGGEIVQGVEVFNTEEYLVD